MKKFTFTFCCIFLLIFPLSAQQISWQALATMPESVTNNSIAAATVNGIPYVYSFSGIDSTKACGSPHLKSFRYNTQTDIWETIAPLPDPNGGKIAAGASTVKNKIYIIGGYHVSPACNEISSAKTHIYDPASNTYLPDGMDLPKAIDDQVQAVWRDSLIYVVSGWSNTANVADVQIYNPTTDDWMIGTSVPAQSQWQVFGASGTIIGDTIYFAGGAGNWNGNNFPPTSTFRKGYINPNNPTEIIWTGELASGARGYRMGAIDFYNKAIWLGGSSITYNFDGIAYNGSGGVSPTGNISVYHSSLGILEHQENSFLNIMDLRGVAKISDNQFVIAGGMEENQKVTNKAFLITIDDLSKVSEKSETPIKVYPNPVETVFTIDKIGTFDIEVSDLSGKVIFSKKISDHTPIDLAALAAGVYFLKIIEKGQLINFQKIIKAKK